MLASRRSAKAEGPRPSPQATATVGDSPAHPADNRRSSYCAHSYQGRHLSRLPSTAVCNVGCISTTVSVVLTA